MSPYNSPHPKRLIMSVGDSRVGKSTTIRLLIDLLYLEGKHIRAYDHDNRQKLEAYQSLIEVESLHFNESTDLVIEELVNNYDAIIVDMPGQHIDKICNYIDEVKLFKILEKVGWRLTFLHPISHRADCTVYLSELLAFALNQADYVIVKNQHFDVQFKTYQKLGHSQVMNLAGTEIVLKQLNKYSYEAIETVKKPYSQISHDINIFSVYRTYAYKWIKSFHQSILNNSLACQYLGLLHQPQQEPIYDDF
ncbi:hypothetical protein [Nostoc parmelioides]|uniref:CobQ/CobB/MinD/ParA nucleotide binding domain-containing protein n=1 Tax=Nostoc parmelioides FACHB-3921 TaxID=2692909 RepID=A0ABR8BKX0_9NOSO|nr:hypothetical protein [Nostoc parmelioides]MBD2254732.1 hypothetical protein [Nostoc parmelioides FACHB-3921]